MFRYVRTAQVAPGKAPKAIEHGQRVAAHLRDVHGTTISFGHEVGGQVGRVYWVSEHEDMAALGTMMEALEADEAFGELMDSGVDNYMAGMTQDRIIRYF